MTSQIDYVTIEVGANGRVVMVEPPQRAGITRRVFSRVLDGSLEWAAFADWRENGQRARFYGFASRELPSSMTCA